MRTQLAKLKANSLVIVVLGVVIFAASSAGSTASNLITGNQIKDHSITGKDIKLHSITSSNISKGLTSLGGPDSPSKGDTGAAGAAGADGKNGNRTWIVSSIPSFFIPPGAGGGFLDVTGAKADFSTAAAHTSIHVAVDSICSAAHGEHISARILVDGSAAAPGAQEICYGAPGGVTLPFTFDRDADLTPGSHTVQFQLQTAAGGMAGFSSTHMTVSEVPN